MKIFWYQFRLDDPAKPQVAGSPQPNLIPAIDAKEWLIVHRAQTVEAFLISASAIDAKSVLDLLVEQSCIPETFKTASMQKGTDRRAIQRFFEMAAGIAGNGDHEDILKAFYDGFHQAAGDGNAGPFLHRLFQRGMWLHERVRQETPFYQIPVEEAPIVIDLANKILGSVENSSLCVCGLDPLLPDMIEAFRNAGCKRNYYLSSPNDHSPLQDPPFRSLQALPIQETVPDDVNILLIYPPGINDAVLKTFLRSGDRRTRLVLALGVDLPQNSKLKRARGLYAYNRSDIGQIVALNKAERAKAAGEVKRWISGEIDAFYQWQERGDHFQFAGIIGRNHQMLKIFELTSRIAQSNITVLIDGESGTGKELVARAIHSLSNRAHKPFRVLNCGAIPENLLESELFGHVRGSFTGAVANKQGLFEAAHQGTIFLDEIGEMPMHLQVKLLRFLQQGEIKRVGSNETIQVDVRVLAATNKDLLEMTRQDHFRSDLYYRLNVIELTIPALRERPEDIPLLVNHFLKHYSKKFRKNVKRLDHEAAAAIRDYDWPGNVRELENAMERAVALAIGPTVALRDLPLMPCPSGDEVATSAASHDEITLKEMEKRHILQTLENCDWNYEVAAKRLAIGRTTLWRKLREYKVETTSDKAKE